GVRVPAPRHGAQARVRRAGPQRRSGASQLPNPGTLSDKTPALKRPDPGAEAAKPPALKRPDPAHGRDDLGICWQEGVAMQSQPASHRRGGVGQSTFSREEWDLLVRLPGRVVIAATSAEPDSPHHSVAEGLAGIDAIAAGRNSASTFVRGVVSAIYAEQDDGP